MPPENERPEKLRHAGRPSRGWILLLIPPYIALLFPGLYARLSPTLLGIPFFYWYMFAWVIVTALLTAVVYLGLGCASENPQG